MRHAADSGAISIGWVWPRWSFSGFFAKWFCQLDLAPFDRLIWPHPNLSY